MGAGVACLQLHKEIAILEEENKDALVHSKLQKRHSSGKLGKGRVEATSQSNLPQPIK